MNHVTVLEQVSLGVGGKNLTQASDAIYSPIICPGKINPLCNRQRTLSPLHHFSMTA